MVLDSVFCASLKRATLPRWALRSTYHGHNCAVHLIRLSFHRNGAAASAMVNFAAYASTAISELENTNWTRLKFAEVSHKYHFSIPETERVSHLRKANSSSSLLLSPGNSLSTVICLPVHERGYQNCGGSLFRLSIIARLYVLLEQAVLPPMYASKCTLHLPG